MIEKPIGHRPRIFFQDFSEGCAAAGMAADDLRAVPTSSRAQRIILWDTVLVNRTSRSGLPICLSRLALIWVNTFALHL